MNKEQLIVNNVIEIYIIKLNTKKDQNKFIYLFYSIFRRRYFRVLIQEVI